MRKKVVRNALLFLLFMALLGLELIWIDRLFLLKETGGVQLHFSQLRRNSVDTVFIGTSHQYCSIDPDLLYDEFGINTYMLATSGQTLPMSYYAAMEAIAYQHPKRIIFEVCYAANGLITINNEMSHYFFDGMPLCKAKKLAIDELIEKEDQIYFYLPLGLYHGRWKELRQVDFLNDEVSKRGGQKADNMVSIHDIAVLADPSEKEELPEHMEEWLEKIATLCRENQVELILYVAPYIVSDGEDAENIESTKRVQRIFNTVGDIASRNGLEYHNLFYELDEIGFDQETDWADTQHLNQNGQAKLTRYMAQKGYIR